MSEDEEDLDDFPKILFHRPNTWLEHIARNQQMNGQLQVESLQKFHHPMMGQLPASSTKNLLRIGLILQFSIPANKASR